MIGQTVGAYQVLAKIGEGGMGEVYRARDTRLGRDVAIKVLPAAFAADADRRARFEREAQTVAALSHQHIVSIFDTGVHEGQIFVVMELLEGETLRERLAPAAGGLPVRKAIEYAVQIARGLAAAHDKGLVHRDLKPDNIFLLADGQVKILDFGLARAAGGDQAGSGATETVAALTDPGMVMGTIGYMAPEQVRGRAVDGRADLFAFGAVLYEMLTGTRAFARDTPADTMSAILKEDAPDLAVVRADLPPSLDRIVRHCLEKNPAERFQSARDVAFALEALSGSAATTVVAAQSGASERPSSRPSRRELAAWGLAIAGIVAAGVVVWRWPAAAPAPPVSRFSLNLDASEAALVSSGFVSPDGQTIVIFVSPAKDTRLRLRRLDAPEMVPLPGTENAVFPFWSPDGRSLGFFADRTLKRFDLATSSVRPIATLGQVGVPVWGRDGTILLATLGQPLSRLSENGGTPEPMGALDKAADEVAQLHAIFLPDGRRFLYQSLRGAALASVIVLGSLDSDTRVVLDVPDTRIVWAGDDRVIFRRADALYAQGITYDPLALVGEATQLVADVEAGGLQGRMEGASAAGTLVFSEPSNRRQQFRWYGRDGRPQATVGEAGRYSTFDLSHDGRRIVAGLRAGSAAVVGGNLWQIDAEQGTMARITVGQSNDVDPRWSPDGTTVIFGSTRDTARGPFRAGLAADTPVPVWKYDGRMFSADDWSRDGKWLLFHDASVPVLMARQMDGSGTPAGEPVVAARALTGVVDQAQMSPDGKWIAYNSNESSRHEVYVAPFPPTGERYSVSRAGGSQATWRSDGGELYYLTAAGALNAVKVSVSGGKFSTSDPVELVRPRLAAVSPNVEQYAPHPSGTRFLFLDTIGDEKNLSIGVLLNWPSLVPRTR